MSYASSNWDWRMNGRSELGGLPLGGQESVREALRHGAGSTSR